MKLSEIKQLLSDLLSVNGFKSKIEKEVSNYKSSQKTLGKSTPVYLTEDDNLLIGKSELEKICDLYLSGSLNESELNYIVDALLLSGNVDFIDENIKEQTKLLTDPEIHGKLDVGNCKTNSTRFTIVIPHSGARMLSCLVCGRFCALHLFYL